MNTVMNLEPMEDDIRLKKRAKESKPSGQKKRGKGRLGFFALGVIILALAVVGAATVVGKIKNTAQNMMSDEGQLQDYNKFLEPVVIFDPDTFDDVKNANPDQMLETVIWATISYDNADPNKYSADDQGRTIIPAADIDAEFKKIYGPDCVPVHRTLTTDNGEYEYAADGTFRVPIIGITPLYKPVVTGQTKKGDSVVLRVAYVSALAEQGGILDKNGEFDESKADKFMLITLRGKKGEQYISAIQNSGDQGTVK